MTVLEIWAGLCLAFWLALTLDRTRRWPREAVLPTVECTDEAAGRQKLYALVPARNEEVTLGRTLPSLLQQDAIDRVVVADDGSEDGTGEAVGHLATTSDRGEALQLVEVPAPPAGWAGKVHAIANATAHVLESESVGSADEPEWWLFTDADIEHGPNTVASLLARARSEEQGGPFDLVSVMARLHAKSFWERLLIPPFVFFFQLLYPFRRVRDPKSRVAAAAGGCVLVRRSIYEAAGGHAAIRDALIDDVELAKLIKGRQGRLWLGLSPDVRSIRPYERLGDLWRMVARSAFVQLRYRVDRLAMVVAGLVLFVAAPPLLIGAAVLSAAGGRLSDPVALRVIGWALLGWLLQARALLPSVRHHLVPAVYCMTLPLAGSLFGLMTLSSAWSHFAGHGPRWRGRTYSTGDGRETE